jgi:hypothetical protein
MNTTSSKYIFALAKFYFESVLKKWVYVWQARVAVWQARLLYGRPEPAVWQARVQISARHPREVFPSERNKQ